MPKSYVEYDLQEGFVANWLTAGPQAVPVEAPSGNHTEDDYKAVIAQKYYEKKSGISGQPVEPGPLEKSTFKVGSYEGQWRYIRCQADHMVDHSTTCPTLTYLRSWAYTQLVSPADQEASFVILSQGPVDVWINKRLVCHTDAFGDTPVKTSFTAALAQGSNKVLVRFAGVASPDGILVMGLQTSMDGLKVHIPTLIPSITRRNELEEVNQSVYADRDIYASDEQIFFCWPEGPEKASYQDLRLQTASKHIYGQLEDVGRPGDKQMIGLPASLPQGEFQAFVMPRAWEYYESNIRVTQEINFYVSGRNRFSEQPYGSLPERCHEALMDAAYHENDVYAELAKMALGAWKSIEPRVMENAIASVNQRQAGSEIQLLGLLGSVIRFGKKAGFPAPIKDQIKDAALNYRYWQDEPGLDSLAFDRESRQIIFHACEILAGQLYPAQTFTNSGLTGRKHREKGETLATAWMEERGANGFVDWDSNTGYAEVLAALSHLVDLAKTETMWDLASVLMDKIFFSIALNSFKGVYGGSQGFATVMDIKGGFTQATAGVTRLMWGVGMFNTHILGTVSLAIMEKYDLPPIIADIAVSPLEESWNQEQSAALGKAINRVSYRTPDYMLSAVQDNHPGMPGRREQIWQATLGPKSVVFVNHPACSSLVDGRSPNYWLGNGSLPRVAQYKDTLVALYNLPGDALLGFTHAYFPVSEFDEYVLRENVAFACKGDGYLALTAANGLELIKAGRTAYRELRSGGKQNAWVCQMGRAAVDGDFAAFQEKILVNRPAFDGLKVIGQTLHDGQIEFDWNGPLTVSGNQIPLSGYPHFENPFTTTALPCREMEIRTDDYLLRLNFGELK